MFCHGDVNMHSCCYAHCHDECMHVTCVGHQDARLARDSELIKTNLKLYDEELEKYIPVLMAQVSHWHLY